MQASSLLVICLLGFLALSFAANPPSGLQVSTVRKPSSVTNFQITTVLGQGNITNNAYGSGNAGLYKPYGLVFIPYNNNTANYTYNSLPSFNGTSSGLLVTDFYNERLLYFPAPFTTSEQAYYVFGRNATNDTSGTSDVFDYLRNVDYSFKGIYAVDETFIAFYPWSMITPGTFAYDFPAYTIGNCPSGTCTYEPLDDVYDAAVKKSTGEIFVVDYGCTRILGFSAASPNFTSTSEPTTVIGQVNSTQCSGTCDANTPSTCFSSVYLLDFDCYDGLWVYDYSARSILYFANNTVVSNFAIQPDSYDDAYDDFNDFESMTVGPACNQLTLTGQYYAYVFQITYLSNQPVAASIQYTIGSYNSSFGQDQTNSLGYMYGVAFPDQSSCFLSDYYNNRVVYFSLGANQTAPSAGAVSPSSNPSLTSTVSLSNTVTASRGSVVVTSTPSLTSTASYTSTASFSSSFSPSAVTPSNTPSNSESTSESTSNTPSFTPITGSAAALSSWTHLF